MAVYQVISHTPRTAGLAFAHQTMKSPHAMAKPFLAGTKDRVEVGDVRHQLTFPFEIDDRAETMQL